MLCHCHKCHDDEIVFFNIIAEKATEAIETCPQSLMYILLKTTQQLTIFIISFSRMDCSSDDKVKPVEIFSEQHAVLNNEIEIYKHNLDEGQKLPCSSCEYGLRLCVD